MRSYTIVACGDRHGLWATGKPDDSRPSICARLGRTSAYTQAIGIIAAESLDEGPERTALMKDGEETEKALDVEKVEDFLDALQSTWR